MKIFTPFLLLLCFAVMSCHGLTSPQLVDRLYEKNESNEAPRSSIVDSILRLREKFLEAVKSRGAKEETPKKCIWIICSNPLKGYKQSMNELW